MKKPEIVDQAEPKTARGKYVNLLERGSNIAVLDRDVVDHFPDSESVNNALRAFLAMSQQFASLTDSAHRPVRRVTGRKTPLSFDPRTGLKNQKAVAAKIARSIEPEEIRCPF